MTNRIKICGVGSVLLGDDAVGPYAAHWIEANYEFGEGVVVEDLGTPGLDLIAYMTGMDVLILIDAVDNHEAPGTVTVYDRAAITKHRPAARMDAHSPIVTESIFVAELAGEAPEHIYLAGVTIEQTEVDAPLSDSVMNALPLLVETVLQKVTEHGGTFRKREMPLDPGIWWRNPAVGIAV
ncbi:MAG: hydrogenase maturation protease [Acidobacteriota bacterium]|nr:hydrogenase maturation protease [Acidobacteriota bacterium]